MSESSEPPFQSGEPAILNLHLCDHYPVNAEVTANWQSLCGLKDLPLVADREVA